MGICGAKWCDFIVYTNKGLSIERIPFDGQYWSNMMHTLKEFYVEHVVPVLCTL